jgi:large subunit ribosomal protein L3
MAGHMGNKRIKEINLLIVKLIPEQNLIVVKGATPGFNGATVILEK